MIALGFLKSFNISASGMTAERFRMRIAAENIANVDTTRTAEGGAYRRKDVVLESNNKAFDRVLKKVRNGNGAGVRVAAVIEDDRELKHVYKPEHPDADENGYVDLPNVDLIKETIDSMAATRAYEANVTAFNAMKLMSQKALEIGR